jgi:hypothetical protein
LQFLPSRVAAAAIIVVIVAIGSVAAFEYMNPQQNHGSTICSTCFVNQQVVDVIIPSLVSSSGGAGGNNLPLNASRGANVSLIVQVFPSKALNVSMGLHILSFPIAGSSDSVLSTFNPAILAITSNSHGNSTLTISIGSDAPIGAYVLAVTAVNLENASQSWGTEINLNVV